MQTFCLTYGCEAVADSAHIPSTGQFPFLTLQCEFNPCYSPHTQSLFIFAESLQVFVRSLQKDHKELVVVSCLQENCILATFAIHRKKNHIK